MNNRDIKKTASCRKIVNVLQPLCYHAALNNVFSKPPQYVLALKNIAELNIMKVILGKCNEGETPVTSRGILFKSTLFFHLVSSLFTFCTATPVSFLDISVKRNENIWIFHSSILYDLSSAFLLFVSHCKLDYDLCVHSFHDNTSLKLHD